MVCYIHTTYMLQHNILYIGKEEKKPNDRSEREEREAFMFMCMSPNVCARYWLRYYLKLKKHQYKFIQSIIYEDNSSA